MFIVRFSANSDLDVSRLCCHHNSYCFHHYLCRPSVWQHNTHLVEYLMDRTRLYVKTAREL